MELGPLRRVAPADQSDPDHRPHRLIPEGAKPERRVRPDGSRAHFLAANAAGKTSIGRGRGNGPILAAAAALKIDLTANGCSVVPQPRIRRSSRSVACWLTPAMIASAALACSS